MNLGGVLLVNRNKVSIKVLLLFVLTVFIFFAGAASVFAAPEAIAATLVTEAPQVRIVIDGVAGEYTDTPIEINDRILLPFRELLTKLGVPNDDDHIIWNEEEESVTVIDGKNEIKLVIGDDEMLLNGEAIKFDVAPYFYANNNRTYVPVRAVSELLNKKILWEDSTTSVYIRNIENYAATIELLKKIEAADTLKMVDAKSVSKIDMNIKTDGLPLPGSDSDGVLSMSMDMTQNLKADLDKNVMHVKQTMNAMGSDIDSEMYFYKNKVFTKLSITDDDWMDVSDAVDFDMESMMSQAFVLDEQIGARPQSEIAMGLASIKGADGTFSLVGEMINITDMNTMVDSLLGALTMFDNMDMDIKINKMQMGTTYDTDFHPTKSIANLNFDFAMTEEAEGVGAITVFISIDMYMTINYEKIGPDFEVVIPDEIVSLV
jgi:hypothetical protein